jgi:mannose-6-phosphate isomerase-like protein (cupin superfamily)
MLPATKAIPEEMPPLVDKPLIQYVVIECATAGITEIVLVPHSSKNAIENYFDISFELESALEARITVNSGEKLSLQMYHHIDEHWIIASDIAKVTLSDETRLVTGNESIYIPIGMTNSLENPAKLPLEVIEVQSGSYPGEDDIVRFEDRYGRV